MWSVIHTDKRKTGLPAGFVTTPEGEVLGWIERHTRPSGRHGRGVYYAAMVVTKLHVPSWNGKYAARPSGSWLGTRFVSAGEAAAALRDFHRRHEGLLFHRDSFPDYPRDGNVWREPYSQTNLTSDKRAQLARYVAFSRAASYAVSFWKTKTRKERYGW